VAELRDAIEAGELLAFLRWLVGEAPDAAGFWPAQAVANHALSGTAVLDTSTAATALPLFDWTGWDPKVAADHGVVALGYPPQRGSYASVAYNNASPNTREGTWLVVHPDSRVTVYAGKVEYGQGIRTGLAIEAADELRVSLQALEVVLADTDVVPWDMGTFGSQSTARVGVQIRKAAATAREALLELAANRLDLPTDELEARDGRVHSRSDPNRSVSYGELVAGQSVIRDLNDDVPLTGAAPNAENIETHNGTTGKLILKLTRSSEVLSGRVLLVICQKPLAQTELNGTRPTFAILRRMKFPTSPSIAAQTLS